MNAKDSYVIAHDVGTSSVKTALISNRGEVVAEATSSYGFSYPKPGWVEQNPEDYWRGTVQNTREILKEDHFQSQQITGMVFSTQAMGIIPMDRENNLLSNNITWVDGRAEDQARWFMNLLGGKRIFEKFYRVPAAGGEEKRGSGLGLTLVKQIVEAHGGTVEVESEVGKGSKFTLKIPLNQPEKA